MNDLWANVGREWFIVAMVWSICWKAVALWKSARKGQKYWFVAILVINSLGLVEIVYLVLNREKPVKLTKAKKPSKSSRK